MKLLMALLVILLCTSCASRSKERKPFMIVSQAQTPGRLFGGINLSGDMSAFSYGGENIGTHFKSFSGVGMSPTAVLTYHFSPYVLNMMYRYRYAWLRHDVTNEKEETLFTEKMQMETSEAEIMLVRGLWGLKGHGCFGLMVSYIPYTDTRLHHLSTAPGWKRHYYGNAVAIGPYWASAHVPVDVWVKYKKSNYNKGFSTQETSVGFDFWLGIF